MHKKEHVYSMRRCAAHTEERHVVVTLKYNGIFFAFMRWCVRKARILQNNLPKSPINLGLTWTSLDLVIRNLKSKVTSLDYINSFAAIAAANGKH